MKIWVWELWEASIEEPFPKQTLIRCEDWRKAKARIYEESIVEETLTSGKYISLFLILILYIYIYIKLKKLRDVPRIFLKKYTKTGNQRKLHK